MVKATILNLIIYNEKDMKNENSGSHSLITTSVKCGKKVPHKISSGFKTGGYGHI